MVTTKFFTVLLAAVVIGTACASVCPHVTGIDWDNGKFIGLWYVYAAYENDLTSGDCVAIDYYDPVGDGVITNFTVSKILDGASTEVVGSYVQDLENPAKLYTTVVGQGEFVAIAIAADDDYENYAMSYACTENDDSTITEVVYIVTKTQIADAYVQGLIDEVIAVNQFGVINKDLLVRTNQNVCSGDTTYVS